MRSVLDDLVNPTSQVFCFERVCTGCVRSTFFTHMAPKFPFVFRTTASVSVRSSVRSWVCMSASVRVRRRIVRARACCWRVCDLSVWRVLKYQHTFRSVVLSRFQSECGYSQGNFLCWAVTEWSWTRAPLLFFVCDVFGIRPSCALEIPSG